MKNAAVTHRALLRYYQSLDFSCLYEQARIIRKKRKLRGRYFDTVTNSVFEDFENAS